MNIKKSVTKLVIYALAILQAAGPSYAAVTAISTVPVDTSSIVPPNVIFGLDDSGSMDFEFIENTNDGAVWYDQNAKSFTDAGGNFNFNSAGISGSDGATTWYKYGYLFPNGSTPDARGLPDSTGHYAIPPTPAYVFMRSSDYNPLYYNPNVTYLPWVSAYIGGASQIFSVANSTTPRSHPWFASSGNNGTSSTSTTFNITTALSSTSTSWTFHMVPGMVIPGATIMGIKGSKNGGAFTNVTSNYTIPSNENWDVAVPYIAATYWLKDSTCTAAWPACAKGPDGSNIRKYEINSTTTFPSGRSYADELQNFANWFQYYRKRKLMLASSMGQVLSQLTNVRGGVIRLNGLAAVTMSDFSLTDPASNWQAVLGAVYTNPASGGTPTRDLLNYIGTQYQRTGTGAPVQYACQRNAAMVLTDGFANASSGVSLPSYTRTTYGNGAPYSTIYSNTLADIALYYYTINLRPDFLAGQVAFDPSNTSPNVDNNRNLHMDTYALSLAVKGTIYGIDATATAAPFSTNPTWPNPSQDRSPTAVDDLWHATINGRGKMLAATNTQDTVTAVQQALTDVLIKAGSQSAVAVSRVNLKAGDSTAYISSYQVNGWYGDLQAFAIDPAAGTISSSNPSWSAQAKLDAIVPSNRKIAIGQSGTAVPFRSNSVSTSTLAALALSTSPTSDGADVLAWLRGDRSKETTKYRKRVHVLGDLVYSEPEVVKGAAASYLDKGYSTFATSIASRSRALYEGGNDGMLHAFDATTGDELWGYIPSFVVSNLKKLASKSYAHQFYVDGTPLSGDVDFGGVNGATDWHTILVSGLRAGGSGFFALDVTTPTATDENAVAQKLLWEFPNSSTPAVSANNVGLSFGKPIIAKVAGQGWVVILSSGYNNTAGDGKGHLFVLNAKTGTLIADIATPAGDTSNPSGLGQLSGFVENGQADATVENVYGGDLQGNLWRFTLKGAPSTWSVTKLAALTDGTNPQPITVAPELSKVSTSAGVRRMVFVGTGQLLDKSDISTISTESFYAIVDDLTSSPLITNVRTKLFQKMMTGTGTSRDISSSAVDYTKYSGWYFDLTAGERVSTDPQLAFGSVVFTSNQPSPSACSSQSYLYTLNLATGGDTSPPPGLTAQPARLLIGQALASRPVILVTTKGTVRVVTHLTNNGVVDTQLPVNISPPPRTMAWKSITR